MVNVAVAGRTSPGLGRCIVTALLQHPQHAVTVLSRSSALPNHDPRVNHLIPDYSSIPALASLFVTHKIHTLIITLVNETASMNLLSAAEQSGTVKRIIASEFAASEKCNHILDLYATKLKVWERLQSMTGMECTAVRCGMFMTMLAKG